MARAFVSGSSQYLSLASALVSLSDAFSVAAWVYVSSPNSGGTTVLSIGNISGDQYAMLFLYGTGDTPAKKVGARLYDGGTFNDAQGTTTWPTGSFFHAGGAYSSAGHSFVYYNGTNEDSATSNIAPTGENTTSIGRVVRSGSKLYLNGIVAEVGIWDTQLIEADFAMLAEGSSPLLVRPQSLVAYWPLIGKTSPEIDVVGSYGMTLNAGPATATHPRVLYPNKPRIILPTGVAPPVVAAYRRRIFVVG